ncbi:hypothetical protein OG787_32255 [Streptomyces sp. NBC_00075]|uniref:Uncharacterized protein n=1 Tax=Streptomyces sp. NBC_00093 TaxID=2975649 RepID=A0AAU2A613_9ACTN
MKIGYSFWGFLGPGITDTPDGGRSHRRPLAPLPDSDEPANRTGHDDAGAGDEELPFVDTRLHEVVVLGAPYDSGELVLGTTDRAGHPITIRSAGPVRIPRTGRKPLLDTPATTDTGSDSPHPRQRARTERIAANPDAHRPPSAPAGYRPCGPNHRTTTTRTCTVESSGVAPRARAADRCGVHVLRLPVGGGW